MSYDAGIQLHGSSKPLYPNEIQQQPVKKSKKTLDEMGKKALLNKNFLDKKTIAYLQKVGLL